MKQFLWTLAACAVLHGAVAPAPALALAASACSKKSPAHSVALLELYTSEGCDSCPPADRFVSALRLAPERAVVLSLHVDYWNYIGWQDPYSKPVFGERQRWLSDLAGSRTIYTPEMFVAGQEMRGGVDGWSAGLPAAVQGINERPARADIGIALGMPGPAGLPVEVSASAMQDGKLYVALVESGLSSAVRAGENRGRVLAHDVVVREWLAPLALSADGKGGKRGATLSRVLPLPPGARTGKLGVSAFVQSDRGEVLQALALPVCGAE
ncbi:MAG TPA: hypothetical protein DCW29_01165 [Janthinobacterium sp.]|nr:hypothetical protein [Janthinobacterium sp.]